MAESGMNYAPKSKPNPVVRPGERCALGLHAMAAGTSFKAAELCVKAQRIAEKAKNITRENENQ